MGQNNISTKDSLTPGSVLMELEDQVDHGVFMKENIVMGFQMVTEDKLILISTYMKETSKMDSFMEQAPILLGLTKDLNLNKVISLLQHGVKIK